MKTPISSEATRALKLSTANGENHDASGVLESGVALSV
jgi:hypothetical protein